MQECQKSDQEVFDLINNAIEKGRNFRRLLVIRG